MGFTGLHVYGMTLPIKPMSPIYQDQLPTGSDIGYQLKWDGVRSLAVLSEGNVTLYSKNMLTQNAAFPEIVALLQKQFPSGNLLLDGELVMFDTVLQRPDFKRIQQRVRSKRVVSTESQYPDHQPMYVVFDILHENGLDWALEPFRSRHQRLNELLPEKLPQLFVTDLFLNGDLLWNWVEERKWEGVVSKRLTSRYHEGKKHQDWWKRKTSILREVDIYGITIREGRVASMVMVSDGAYFGRVSLGLNGADKEQLMAYAATHSASCAPFSPLPMDLKKEHVLWLSKPLSCEVTGLEITHQGMLRHPKISRKPKI
ncbi:DNA ligase [Paenibacillus sp. GCM10027629]|uniref:ATP-dependent DNA ligase n=1 Tax=Paenibacillus sp. GCM10027629 TaxID=3273414 RepID=UPI003641D682